MRKKLKPGQDLDSVQSDLIETVCYNYKNGVSVRALSKQMELSPMKTRKILITGGCYSTDLSTEIGELYKDGKTVGEIAEILNTTPANVNSYLPYERIIYNMEERSVEADRQARYRERLRNGEEEKESAQPRVIERVERVRDKTMIIVVGKKLRKMLPAGVFDNSSDPLSRDHSYAYSGYENGEFDQNHCPESASALQQTCRDFGHMKDSCPHLFSPTTGYQSEDGCPAPFLYRSAA